MKYPSRRLVFIFISALVLIFSGCSGFNLSPDDTEAVLRIVIGPSPILARTIFPNFSSLDTEEGKFVKYDVEIAGGDRTFAISSDRPDFFINNSAIEAVYPYGGLVSGPFTISVKAYRTGENGDNYSAFGTVEFTLGPGSTTVIVKISPIIKVGATGTLSYKITGYSDAILLSYSDFEPEPNPEELDPVEEPDFFAVTGIFTTLLTDGIRHDLELQSGYYVLKFTNSDGVYYIEVVNIYKNFITELIIEY